VQVHSRGLFRTNATTHAVKHVSLFSVCTETTLHVHVACMATSSGSSDTCTRGQWSHIHEEYCARSPVGENGGATEDEEPPLCLLVRSDLW